MTTGPHTDRTIASAVEDIARRVRVRLVSDAAGLEQVFRLRHDCYREEGAIAPRADRRMTDVFDSAENAMIFGLFEAGALIGSIRLQLVSAAAPRSLSAMAFPDIIGPLLDDGHLLLDPTRFVIDSDASRRNPYLAYFALRVPFMAAHHFKVDYALAAVRAEHMPFYSRALQYKAVAEPRPYLMLSKPLGLMLADYQNSRSAVIDRYPFFSAGPGEENTLLANQLAEA